MRLWIRTLAFLSLALFTSAAQAADKGEAFTLAVENDTRRLGGPNSDDGYTNGFRIAYTYAEDRVPNWVPTLTDWSEELRKQLQKSTTNFGLSLTQKIYTPDDTDKTTLITDDRPYAAWLYVGFTANYKTDVHSHSLELDLGMVGPAAMGERAQNGFHNLIDIPEAQGWDNQLNNEPTLQLSYFQKQRFVDVLDKDTGRMLDIIPMGGISAGNVLIAVHAGVMGRVGINIPNDFGPTRPSASDGDMIKDPRDNNPSLPWRAYGFASARGSAVAHNLFLDGNTFGGSHSVTRRPFVFETDFGYGLQYKNLSFIWRFVTVSPEFEERNTFHSFASITISYYRDLD